MNLLNGAISVTGISYFVFYIFSILFLGYALGRIKIKGISLGTDTDSAVSHLFFAEQHTDRNRENFRKRRKQRYVRIPDAALPFADRLRRNADFFGKHSL